MLSHIQKIVISGRPGAHLFKRSGARHLCDSTSKPTNNGNTNSISDKVESSVTKYEEAYRQLDKLDMLTAAKILFNDPPKKKKFGLDFHLVQFFFACLPSVAVYLVAQYARSEMRKMDAELERKKKEEEDKAKERELKTIQEEEARADSKILEVRERLEKLEEAVKEIVGATKKHSGEDLTKEANNDKQKHLEPTESSQTSSAPESRNEETAKK